MSQPWRALSRLICLATLRRPQLPCQQRQLSAGTKGGQQNPNKDLTVYPLPRVYEPEYLDAKPDYPTMSQFQLSFTCHEYPLLERFAKYAQGVLRHQFDMSSCDMIAWPRRTTVVDLYQAESTKVIDTFQLVTYRRVLMVDDLPAVEAGLLINLLTQNLPEGVTMTFQQATEEDTEFRYVPDLEIQELKKQVDMGRSGQYKI